MNYFRILGKMVSLNEYTNACRSHWSKGARMKSDMELLVSLGIRSGLKAGTLHPTDDQSIIRIEWYEKTKKRDVDNIHSSVKFVLDAMVKCGVIPNDSRKYVSQIYQKVIDADEDYAIVSIE